jgi:hypothetical protein
MAFTVTPTKPTKKMPWSAEWRLCLAFCLRPRLARYPYRQSKTSGWLQDWLPTFSVGRLFAWALALWVINLFILGPIVVSIVKDMGADSLLDPKKLPWLLAIVWAPIVEEILFRFGLRRPAQALWVLPLICLAIWHGLGWVQSIMIALTILLAMQSTRQVRHLSARRFRLLRQYRHYFPWVMHLSLIGFAGLHLLNFKFTDINWLLLPLLVMPQWLAGLVMSWVRVTRSLADAICLHALYNFGPLLAAWVVISMGGSNG